MSVLEDRMRRIAREEIGSGGEETAADGPDRVGELEEKLAVLTARVDELEKSAVTHADLQKAAVTQSPAGKRTARKAAEPSEKTAESTE